MLQTDATYSEKNFYMRNVFATLMLGFDFFVFFSLLFILGIHEYIFLTSQNTLYKSVNIHCSEHSDFFTFLRIN
jgi:hypothetical protein